MGWDGGYFWPCTWHLAVMGGFNLRLVLSCLWYRASGTSGLINLENKHLIIKTVFAVLSEWYWGRGQGLLTGPGSLTSLVFWAFFLLVLLNQNIVKIKWFAYQTVYKSRSQIRGFLVSVTFSCRTPNKSTKRCRQSYQNLWHGVNIRAGGKKPPVNSAHRINKKHHHSGLIQEHLLAFWLSCFD